MIIPVDTDANGKLKEAEQSDVIVNRAVDVLDDPPPAYSNSQSQAVAGPTAIDAPSRLPIPTSVKPTNFLSLSRGKGSIKGTYPALPPLAADETESTRRNVYMHTSNGLGLFRPRGQGVQAESEHLAQVVEWVYCRDDACAANNSSPSQSESLPIERNRHNPSPPHIPRPAPPNQRNGSVRFSDALKADLTTFSEVNSTRRCFLGDFSDWTEEGWGR
ncbi:hypothetical protein B0H13DRAFT_1855545 [Mycena leptocephala]|nr:hypothetical protein B0H13DRAFT_1855545 [Mycena leptocephala]